MRIGTNPQKAAKKITMTTRHRVIIVVYLPNEDGFYKAAFDVFKTCLDSVIATIDNFAAITVVNNASNQKTADFLNQYLTARKIDSVITHSTNIGKIDALIGAARGAREEYITLTDADILFVSGWQHNVEKVFSNFKNVGSVSPIPVKRGLYHGTLSVLIKILLNKVNFRFEAIPENFEAYSKYLDSINWDLDKDDSRRWPVIETHGFKAVVGSGHQVLTIKREILFKTVPTNPSLALVGAESEHIYVDAAIDLNGGMRLSTYHNYAFHMGNNLEQWMIDLQQKNTVSLSERKNTDILVEKDLFVSDFKRKLYSFKKRYIRRVFAKLYGQEYGDA